MDFKQAESYLLGFTDYEKIPGIAYTAENYDLRRMRQLLEPLGNPHLAEKTVHVAGTKGKGSTAAMIASVLTGAGYRTGLYTSPHLHLSQFQGQKQNPSVSSKPFSFSSDSHNLFNFHIRNHPLFAKRCMLSAKTHLPSCNRALIARTSQ